MATIEAVDKQRSPHEPALVALCSKAVNLTISISTHLSDYTDSTDVQSHALHSFFAKIGPLYDVLRQIQAGISELSKARTFVPYKASQELSTKMQHVVRDLVSGDLLVVKLITSARKKGFKKFVDGFRRASLDTEILMLADTMTQHHSTLRIGWVTFTKVLSKVDWTSSNNVSYLASTHGDDGLELLSEKIPVHRLVSIAPDTAVTTQVSHSHHQSQTGMSATPSTSQIADTDQHETAQTSATLPRLANSTFSRDEAENAFDAQNNWINPSFSSTDHPWRLDSFSRSSSFRLNPTSIPPDMLQTRLPDRQRGPISPGSATQTTVHTAKPQPQNGQSLEQQLRGVPNGDPVVSSLLLQAVREGDVMNAKLLLEHGADAHLDVTGGMSAFAQAAQHNQKEIVQLMLDCGANIKEPLPSGDLPLNICISQGTQTDIIELLLASGVNPNGKTRDGKTPLFEALSMRRVDIVSLLLDHGASPNLAGPKHPLWPATYLPEALKLLIDHGAKSQMASGNMELAASINSIQSVQILLDAGVSPNLKKDGTYTPLCTAIRDDRADIVTLLLKHGADPNLPASEYPAWKCITHNRLHFLPSLVAAGADLHNPPGIVEQAVACNNKDALMYLLLNGVSVNICNNEGRSPLTTAIRDERVQLIEMLLSHGASVTLRGEDWPLCMAVRKPEILRRLLEHVHNTNTVTKGIIELAVQADQLESIQLLVQAGISVEDRTGGVFSPLTSAIRENRKPIVRYLLDEAHADVNSPGEHLPLVKAIRRCNDSNDTEVIEMLLERGADINLIYRGWNAIMQAIEKGDKKLIHILIQKGNGIDLQTVDTESGQTVYDMIHDRGWSEGVQLLMEHRHQLRMVTDGSTSKN